MVFGPDDVERRVPDVATARDLIDERAPRYRDLVDDLLTKLRQLANPEDERFLRHVRGVLLVAYARLACRHGSWGTDRHAYHNEYHIWEIIHDRISALARETSWQSLTAQEWALLAVFAACHDLRQRESGKIDSLVGPNERASAEETARILRISGFDPEDAIDRQAMDDLDLMIGGSTFETDADADHVLLPTGGAVASALVRGVRQRNPDWQDDDAMRRRLRLTLTASDLDTANVAEPFPLFARSAARLCAEMEMRCGRPDLGAESAQPVLQFLTAGQEYYFFQLHHFDSRLGRQIFTTAKEANAPKVLAISQQLRDQFGNRDAESGQAILDTFIVRADDLG